MRIGDVERQQAVGALATSSSPTRASRNRSPSDPGSTAASPSRAAIRGERRSALSTAATINPTPEHTSNPCAKNTSGGRSDQAKQPANDGISRRSLPYNGALIMNVVTSRSLLPKRNVQSTGVSTHGARVAGASGPAPACAIHTTSTEAGIIGVGCPHVSPQDALAARPTSAQARLMTTATAAPLSALGTPTRVGRNPRDRVLDEALDRMRVMVVTLLAVREEHHAVMSRTRWLKRPIRFCAACGSEFPCSTRRLLRTAALPRG